MAKNIQNPTEDDYYHLNWTGNDRKWEPIVFSAMVHVYVETPF